MSQANQELSVTPSWYAALFTKKMFICFCIGFSSGLPIFVFPLLSVWLLEGGVSIAKLGGLTLMTFPYVFKVFWSPLLDRYAIQKLGRRRTWMIGSQLLCLVLIASFGLFFPLQPNDVFAAWEWGGLIYQITQLECLILLGTALAVASATQDIAIDAYRREILTDKEQGLGVSWHVNAYRLAGLVPGSLALILTQSMAWPAVFGVVALFMLPGLILSAVVSEPSSQTVAPKTLSDAITKPFLEFIQREGLKSAVWVLAFILFYKLGDGMATALSSVFYKEMGFGNEDLGTVVKLASLVPMIVGGLLGGLWMNRLGVNRALWIFGLVQLGSILGFALLAYLGPFEQIRAYERVLLGCVVAFEYFGVGLGTVASLAFIARATSPIYAAVQFSLFTSLAAIPSKILGASTGVLVEHLGWTHFFYLCTVLAVPGMLILLKVAPWQTEK
ncbi:MAG: MFS transporter [Neisseriaceae bacterium]|nr:MFS transporter [Neisseriaceae bacterium]